MYPHSTQFVLPISHSNDIVFVYLSTQSYLYSHKNIHFKWGKWVTLKQSLEIWFRRLQKTHFTQNFADLHETWGHLWDNGHIAWRCVILKPPFHTKMYASWLLKLLPRAIYMLTFVVKFQCPNYNAFWNRKFLVCYFLNYVHSSRHW